MTEIVAIERAIRAERFRQEALVEQGKFEYTCASSFLDSESKFLILGEAVGEVARAVPEQDLANLKEELIQVAAVCVAWLESL